MTSPYVQEKSGCNELESDINRRRGRLTTLTGGLKKGLHVLSGDKAFFWATGQRHLDLFFLEICLAFPSYLIGNPFFENSVCFTAVCDELYDIPN